MSLKETAHALDSGHWGSSSIANIGAEMPKNFSSRSTWLADVIISNHVLFSKDLFGDVMEYKYERLWKIMPGFLHISGQSK